MSKLTQQDQPQNFETTTEGDSEQQTIEHSPSENLSTQTFEPQNAESPAAAMNDTQSDTEDSLDDSLQTTEQSSSQVVSLELIPIDFESGKEDEVEMPPLDSQGENQAKSEKPKKIQRKVPEGCSYRYIGGHYTEGQVKSLQKFTF